MAKLLRFEFHKLIRQKSFYICLAVAVAMLVVSTYTTYLMSKDVMDTAEMGIDAMNVMIGSASGGVLSMVIGVFIPLFACEDYVSGTIRNIVTRGYSRLGIFSAKLIAVMLATAVMTIACMAAGYLIGLIFSGPGVESFDANTVKILLCQLAVMLAEGALFYAISTVLQKTGRLYRRVSCSSDGADHCPNACRHSSGRKGYLALCLLARAHFRHAFVV